MRGRLHVLLVAALVFAGMAIGVVALELGLRLLPVTKGLYLAHDPSPFPLPRYEPHLHWTHSIGWDLRSPVHGVTNNYGQVSPYDYRRLASAVVLIGDSFVEGELNPYADSMQGRLKSRYSGQYDVYSFGLGGNSLSDYAATAAIVAREFSVRWLVFFIEDGDITESADRDPGHYRFVERNRSVELEYESLPPVTWRGRLLRRIDESSLLFYLFSNLKFRLDDLTPSILRSARHSSTSSQGSPLDDRIVEAFLARLTRTGVPANHVLLVLDGDRYRLYQPAAAATLKDAPRVWQRLQALARMHGFQVLDMGPVFAEDYAAHRRKFDFYPVDRHLDGYGNDIVAQHVAAVIRAGEPARP